MNVLLNFVIQAADRKGDFINYFFAIIIVIFLILKAKQGIWFSSSLKWLIINEIL